MTTPVTASLLLKTGAPVYTGRQEIDARGALIRGLAEYLESLSWIAWGGREVSFQKVRREWAEPEQLGVFPSAAVYVTGPSVFSASGFGPSVPSREEQLPAPDSRYLINPVEIEQTMTVEVWATDPVERAQLCALLEKAFNPVLYMSGWQLMLPFYFGAHATYVCTEFTTEDDPQSAAKRFRRALYVVTGTVPVIQLVTLPNAKPRFDLREVGPDVVLEIETQ